MNGMVVTLLENRSRGLYTFLKEDGEKWTKQISGLHLLKIKDPDDMPQVHQRSMGSNFECNCMIFVFTFVALELVWFF